LNPFHCVVKANEGGSTTSHGSSSGNPWLCFSNLDETLSKMERSTTEFWVDEIVVREKNMSSKVVTGDHACVKFENKGIYIGNLNWIIKAKDVVKVNEEISDCDEPSLLVKTQKGKSFDFRSRSNNRAWQTFCQRLRAVLQKKKTGSPDQPSDLPERIPKHGDGGSYRPIDTAVSNRTKTTRRRGVFAAGNHLASRKRTIPDPWSEEETFRVAPEKSPTSKAARTESCAVSGIVLDLTPSSLARSTPLLSPLSSPDKHRHQPLETNVEKRSKINVFLNDDDETPDEESILQCTSFATSGTHGVVSPRFSSSSIEPTKKDADKDQTKISCYFSMKGALTTKTKSSPLGNAKLLSGAPTTPPRHVKSSGTTSRISPSTNKTSSMIPDVVNTTANGSFNTDSTDGIQVGEMASKETSPMNVEVPNHNFVFQDAILTLEDEFKHPIHAAVKYGYLQDVKQAVEENESEINAIDTNGRTALDLAALTGQKDIVAYLKDEKGAEKRKTKRTMHAIVNRRAPQMMENLEAARGELARSLEELAKRVKELARSSEEFPTEKDYNDIDNLPLHIAVMGGHIDDVKDNLEDCRDKLNVVDSKGRSPLDLAALSGSMDIVDLLEEKGGLYKIRSKWAMRAFARGKRQT